ncbi:MAG TPA: CpsD/CapB family tyrosine-protein kinase [Terriglobia bacterium]|nr:CpsD/CapB family tyrosine-protein kinase [Terriglobia bacterium]
MSRIHDALKKAEQDRAQSTQSRVEAGAPGAPEDAPLASTGVDLPGADLGSQGTVLTTAGAGTAESLMTSAAPMEWKPDRRTMVFTNGFSGSAGAEEFRTLRSHLTQLREKQPLQTVLVTSALPGEGKTFVAANLALSIAQQKGRRVLLLDADLRLPQLHVSLGAPANPGLTDYLKNEADLASIIQRGVPENLFFIPGGTLVSNPVELISSGRLKTLLHRLSPLFDWIILDSPPSVPLSDASLLAEHCDGVLLVVRAGVTPFDMAQRASHLFADKHPLGVVLNRVSPHSSYSAYYYSGYYSASKNGDKG